MEGVVTRKRLPSVERLVKEIKDDDKRVRILGMVVDKKERVLVVDDGTGSITVTFDEDVGVKKNDIVRIIGRVMESETGKEMHGEIIQKANGVDVELYKKVHKLWSELKF